MFIEAKKFLDDIELFPCWMSLGGKTDKARARRKREFDALKAEATKALNEREGVFFCLGLCIVVLTVALGVLLRVMLGDTINHLTATRLIPTVTVLMLVVPMPLILLAIFTLCRLWYSKFKTPASIKLDDFQEMLYGDIVYLLRLTWMTGRLDWVRLGEEKAREAWLGCLRNMAAEVKSLEHKISLPDYPEKESDEMQLEETREALNELYRILKQFGLITLEKAELYAGAM